MTATLDLPTQQLDVNSGDVRAHSERMLAVERPAPPVPDHIPDALAAEHADAASVVGRPRRPKTVRVVGRGDEPRSAIPAFALSACIAIAALAPNTTASPQQPLVQPPTRVEAVAPSDASATVDSCGTDLLATLRIGCTPTCPDVEVRPTPFCDVASRRPPIGDTAAASPVAVGGRTPQLHAPVGG
jgi:hypothetical protein